MGGVDVDTISTARRWTILGIALGATLFANVFINGIAFLIPTLHRDAGLDLAQAGLISAMPSFGMVLTLVAWGYAVDRFGERAVLVLGATLTALAAFGAARADSLVLVAVLLFVGGMAAASSNVASARMVVGWFPPRQRGLAMGIRQTAQPLGVGLGAMVIPQLAAAQGVSVALLFPAALCAVAAMASWIGLVDPTRPERADADPSALANPYSGSNTLWRIHAVSVLLVVPQVLVWTFTLVWLMTSRGWSAGAAGALVTVAQLFGAAGRIAAGRWSDRVGSRLRPIRTIAAAAGVTMGLLAVTEFFGSPLADSPLPVALMLVASVVTVSDNGLAFTAIAEIAGPFWSGRALGVQNTNQLFAAGVVPPAFGALIGAAGYGAAFAVCAVFPLLALPLIPVRGDPLSRRE